MVGRRLGRGLDFFLSGDAENAEPGGADEVRQLDVTQLVPSSFQPRREFSVEDLEELANSVRSSGILQPVLVRKAGEKFEIIAGERRWRAAQMAGLDRVPALVRDATDEMTAVFGLVENVHRADLNAIEKAKALRRIQAMTKASQEEMARQVGLERSSVANLLRLLDLPDEVQGHVSRGTLTMGHARALLGLANDEEQKLVAEEIMRKRLSVRDVEDLVRGMQDHDAPKKAGDSAAPRRSRGERPLWLHELEENLVEALGTPVTVRYGRKRSKIVIECIGREEFERVYELLKTRPDSDE